MRLLFRADAAFARPEVYEYLEGEGIGDAIRPPSNEVLEKQREHLTEHAVEWPSRGPVVCYRDFNHQARSWDRSRREVAEVEWNQGELFARVGFIVTNFSYPTKGIVSFYNG